MIERELKKARLALPEHPSELGHGAGNLGYSDIDQVYAALGRGDIGPTAVIKQFFADHDPAEVAGAEGTAPEVESPDHTRSLGKTKGDHTHPGDHGAR